MPIEYQVKFPNKYKFKVYDTFLFNYLVGFRDVSARPRTIVPQPVSIGLSNLLQHNFYKFSF